MTAEVDHDVEANRTGMPRTAVAHWRAMAVARGDATAVRSPDGSITFSSALSHADDRARAIAAAVVEPGRPVAVDVESDVESVLSVLAVLCSGHPVIFLDPLLPDDRREHILRISGARRFAPSDIAALPASDAPVAEPQPGDPAVIIFTSGSTGAPKGVVHAQQGWVNQAVDGREVLGFGPGDREAVLLPLSFGAGFDCLIMGLLNGVTLLLWDVRRRTTTGLRDWLADSGATTMHCTPSLLRSWLPELDAAAALGDLRLLTTCGEPVHHDDVERTRSTVLPDGVFCSWSGSSEMGNLAFNRFPRTRAVPPGAIPVGTPASDKHVRILDEDGVDLPAGTAGEIVVESANLALGYHDDPELTAGRFRPLEDGRTRLYTGDLGRFDESGQLHLLGRRDDAIKVRGYLVEPVEVEAAIRALRWTVDAVVTADRESGRLTAHVAVDPDRWHPAPAEIRIALGKTLAPWMIPQDVIVMAQLPRNERGKVDRAALPPPPERTPEPVRGPTEAALLHIWCGLLGLDTVGRNEDFISLGGDSLAAARLLTEIRDRWLVDIATADFAAAPTIAALGERMDRAHQERAQTAAVRPITELRSGTGEPVFLAAGAGSPAAGLLPLVRHLDGEFPVYGLQAHGLESRGRADRSVRAAARRAVRDIVAVQPAGPYRLAGYSFGAFVMLEAASMLRARGARCEVVVLIDALFEPELRARVESLYDARGLAPRGRGAVDEPGGAAASAGVAAGAGVGLTHVLPDRSAVDDAAAHHLSPIRQRMKLLWNRCAMQFLVATAGLLRLPTTLQWTVFWDLGRQLLSRHRPTPYPGRVTLIMADTNPDDECLWSGLATGELDIVRVVGDHHSMMRAPHVSGTAAVVDSALRDCGQEVPR
ncbi:AMP-binding protein [Gordonia sp. CPCC 206044]|uniref:AMP-binding protein n=1 Tax=Gordonia sp. CPCC 206044 TaxID=3140793 RepID=UPI003AF3EEBF